MTPQTDTERYAAATAEVARLAELLAQREREHTADRVALREAEDRALESYNLLADIRNAVDGPHFAALPGIVRDLVERAAPAPKPVQDGDES